MATALCQPFGPFSRSFVNCPVLSVSSDHAPVWECQKSKKIPRTFTPLLPPSFGVFSVPFRCLIGALSRALPWSVARFRLAAPGRGRSAPAVRLRKALGFTCMAYSHLHGCFEKGGLSLLAWAFRTCMGVSSVRGCMGLSRPPVLHGVSQLRKAQHGIIKPAPQHGIPPTVKALSWGYRLRSTVMGLPHPIRSVLFQNEPGAPCPEWPGASPRP